MTELRDFRVKLTLESMAALDAEAAVTNQERTEIVRDIVHAWAMQQQERATLLDIKLKSEGLPGITGDSRRQPVE